MAAPSTANDRLETLLDPMRAARALIGWRLYGPDGAAGIIVETEAYTHEDPASHSFRGETRRNGSMFLGAGHAYVYRSYGVHRCMNVVTGLAGDGSAVLIRALQPTVGLESMRSRRGLSDLRLLCAGPGRLTRALGIDLEHDGLNLLRRDGMRLEMPEDAQTFAIVCSPRIGITKAADWPRRFTLADSPFVSRGVGGAR